MRWHSWDINKQCSDTEDTSAEAEIAAGKSHDGIWQQLRVELSGFAKKRVFGSYYAGDTIRWYKRQVLPTHKRGLPVVKSHKR